MHDPHALPGTDVVVDGVRLHVVRHGRDGHDGEPPLLLPVVGLAYANLLRLGGEVAARLTAGLIGPTATDYVAPRGELAAYAGALRAPDGPRSLREFVAAFDGSASQAALEVVAAAPPPTLVLWGEDDRRSPTESSTRDSAGSSA